MKEGLHTGRFCTVVEEFSKCGIIDIFVYKAVWFEVVDKHQKMKEVLTKSLVALHRLVENRTTG